ncbi:hypothetical protein CDD83_1881 [Cordyceps sp. RAO-2017]|nr:hypothetical protein CDD83_1881 [Cordyceps sp. RAO-2017]
MAGAGTVAEAKADAAVGPNKSMAQQLCAASGRIKYADPRDLPSYPSTGFAPNGAAASAAATSGWANQKPFEHWKPDRSSSASAAAVHAKDYRMSPLWEPDKSPSASAAAVHAKDYKMSPLWEPTANPHGHRAAVLAIGSADSALKQLSVQPVQPR